MIVAQRDIWWAEFGEPEGSSAGYRRPVIVVQCDAINTSRLQTYLCVPLTGAPGRQAIAWNLPLSAKETGLDRDSVAQTTLMVAVAEHQLSEWVGRITERQLSQLFTRLDIALGRVF